MKLNYEITKKRVIAGSYRDYLNWLYSNDFNPNRYQYAPNKEALMGNHNKVIFGKLYYLSPAYDYAQTININFDAMRELRDNETD